MYCQRVLRRRQREELWEMERVLSWARDFSFSRTLVHCLAAVSLFASAFCNLEWQKRLRKTRGLWAALQTWAKKMSNKTHEASGVAFLTLRNLLGITIPMLIHYWYIPSQFAHPQPNTAQDQPDQKKNPANKKTLTRPGHTKHCSEHTYTETTNSLSIAPQHGLTWAAPLKTTQTKRSRHLWDLI